MQADVTASYMAKQAPVHTGFVTLFQTSTPLLFAGAGALGLVLTAVLPNILEDALALALAAAVGYLALLNLPLRRAEAKGKVERVAANFAKVGLNH